MKKSDNRKDDRAKEKVGSGAEVGMRLNKYVAHCGVASRRAAADLIKQGRVAVNGKIEKAPGYQIEVGDVVTFDGKKLQPEERQVYILMNKPKDAITTVKDERGRRTVIDLLRGKIKERIFPVGRLDRETTGLLLLTNDGDLAEKMTHPRYQMKKVYYASLDKELHPADLKKIEKGLQLEDGPVQVDWVEYLPKQAKTEVGLEIHVGRNRIVRRIFEHLGYHVRRLDRVYLGGLTKKDLKRGGWRHLTQQQIIMLQLYNKQPDNK